VSRHEAATPWLVGPVVQDNSRQYYNTTKITIYHNYSHVETAITITGNMNCRQKMISLSNICSNSITATATVLCQDLFRVQSAG
jgi:hypothetical protein